MFYIYYLNECEYVLSFQIYILLLIWLFFKCHVKNCWPGLCYWIFICHMVKTSLLMFTCIHRLRKFTRHKSTNVKIVNAALQILAFRIGYFTFRFSTGILLVRIVHCLCCFKSPSEMLIIWNSILILIYNVVMLLLGGLNYNQLKPIKCHSL